jgi:hypothetical protein
MYSSLRLFFYTDPYILRNDKKNIVGGVEVLQGYIELGDFP